MPLGSALVSSVGFRVSRKQALNVRAVRRSSSDCPTSSETEHRPPGLCAQRSCTPLPRKTKSGQNVRLAHRPQACVPWLRNSPPRFRLSAERAIQKIHPMKVTKNIGMLLLAVYLIIDGLLGFGINFGPAIFLLYLIALAAGIFILIGK